MCQLALSQINTQTLFCRWRPTSGSTTPKSAWLSRLLPDARPRNAAMSSRARACTESVARDGLRIGVVFFDHLLNQTQRLTLFAKAVQVRLRCSAPPTLVQEAHNPIELVLRQPHQSIAPPFFLAYSGSGEVSQCLALCQRTPILAKVARIVSPDTRSLVRPSSKLTSAAISIVQRVLSLPNSLGLRWSISPKAFILFSSKVR